MLFVDGCVLFVLWLVVWWGWLVVCYEMVLLWIEAVAGCLWVLGWRLRGVCWLICLGGCCYDWICWLLLIVLACVLTHYFGCVWDLVFGLCCLVVVLLW